MKAKVEVKPKEDDTLWQEIEALIPRLQARAQKSKGYYERTAAVEAAAMLEYSIKLRLR